jgi:hypothetical protein
MVSLYIHLKPRPLSKPGLFFELRRGGQGGHEHNELLGRRLRLHLSVLRPPFVDDLQVMLAGRQKLHVAPFGI